ncbi:MAG: NADH-quinone oxidoreductase subunit NuoN [Alphaproteobacteria bacterium]|nr:NADH-quinone oxidoreductase subunit NuoN [Alphaproteobacteria bacterium]
MQLIDLYPISAEIFLAIAGMLLLLWGAIAGEKATRAISIGAGLSFIIAIATALHHQVASAITLGGHVGSNAYVLLIKVLLLLSALAALVLSHHFLKSSKLSRPEYPVLILFATLGMMLMISAESLLGLYMGLELQSLTLYVLAAFRRDNAKSSEAGLKYFVLGALASGLLLYGISLIYGGSGTILFTKLHEVVVDKAPVELVLGFVFILAAMAFKISAVPFHMWTPDVYEGAPTPVTAFFAAAPKLAGIALLIKLLYGPFAGLLPQSTPIIVVLSVASMAIGSFAAIAQSNIKRMMAYSSIGHVGFALVGLVAGGVEGVQATLLYLLIYVPMTLGAFGIILSLRRDDVYLEQISDLAGLSKTRPALAVIMTVFLFSMMGIPPLAGFFSKLYVFLAAVEKGYVWLAVLGVCLSVVGAFYYLRIIKIMYFDKQMESFQRVSGWGIASLLGVTVLFILAFVIKPDMALAITHDAAAALINVK